MARSPLAPRQASRVSRCSPTRSALAIAVSAGFTAPMLGEDARVHDVEVVELGPAAGVQRRRDRIHTEPAGIGLMRTPGHRDLVLHVGVPRPEVVRAGASRRARTGGRACPKAAVPGRAPPTPVPMMIASYASMVKAPRASRGRSCAPQPRSARDGRTPAGSSPGAALSPGRTPRRRGRGAWRSAAAAPSGRGLVASLRRSQAPKRARTSRSRTFPPCRRARRRSRRCGNAGRSRSRSAPRRRRGRCSAGACRHARGTRSSPPAVSRRRARPSRSADAARPGR